MHLIVFFRRVVNIVLKNLSKEKFAVIAAAVVTFLVTSFFPDMPYAGACSFFFGEPDYPSED